MPTSPRTIIFCLSLFLASAFIAFAARSRPHRPASLPGSWLPSFHSTDRLAPPSVAFATYIPPDTGNLGEVDKAQAEGAFLSARVLAYSLLQNPATRPNTSIPLLVLATKGVSRQKLSRLKRDGAIVHIVEPPAHHDRLNGANAHELAVLNLFKMTQYHKVAFLAPETLVTGSLEGVFFDEATLTSTVLTNPAEIKEDEGTLPRTYVFACSIGSGGTQVHGSRVSQEMGAGFWVMMPAKSVWEYYISLLKFESPRFDPSNPLQGLLSWAHRREGNMPWSPIWDKWNVVESLPPKALQGSARSFQAKYWKDGEQHDPELKALWREQKAEMDGYWRGRESP